MARQMAFRRRLSDSGVTTAAVNTPDQLELAVYHALVNLGRFRGPVFAVPPLRGDEIARAGLMKDLVAACSTSFFGLGTELAPTIGQSNPKSAAGIEVVDHAALDMVEEAERFASSQEQWAASGELLPLRLPAQVQPPGTGCAPHRWDDADAPHPGRDCLLR
jgi:hypothetical protein